MRNTMRSAMLFFAACLLLSAKSSAQDSAPAPAMTSGDSAKLAALQEQIANVKGQADGINEDYLATKSTVDKLAKIKVSGYLQAQFRYATDTTGSLKSDYSNIYNIGEFQGGNLPAATQSVFQVRRARIKTMYETPLTQMVVQLDCLPFTTANVIEKFTPDTIYDTLGVRHIVVKNSANNKAMLSGGGVSIKDAFLRFSEPWLRSIALKAGVFDRPFGFEISYSSSSRESPERSRLFQTLFPGERDLGVSLEYLAGDNLPSWAGYLNFKGGLFAGNGINIEFDDVRDFIGRLGFSVPLNDINLAIDGGASGYFGAVRDRSDSLYSIKNKVWTGEAGNKWKDIDRQYMGGDVQLYYGNIPVLGGITVRGEYIQGQQPAGKSSSQSNKSDLTTSSAVYLRNFSGYYAMAVLNIDPINCQLVGKYDAYDPNTDVTGADVKSTTEMSYATLGGGLIYHWDENVKLIAYYDQVKNEEKTGVAAPFNKDVNDNVFTLRIQYKF